MKEKINDEKIVQKTDKKCGCGLVHATINEENDFISATSRGGVPKDKRLSDVAELFKVFGDFTRTKIISLLRTGEHQVDDIAREIGMTKSAVSHQLRILRQTKIVKHRKSGRGVYYSLDDEHIFALYDLALEHVLEGEAHV